MRTYTTPQACRLVGVTFRMADYWARKGIVVPSIMDANGSGTRRCYSLRDVIELSIVKAMLGAGLALTSARKTIASLAQVDDRELGDVRIVYRDDEALIARDDMAVLELLTGAHAVSLLVDVGRVVENLAAREAELGLVSA